MQIFLRKINQPFSATYFERLILSDVVTIFQKKLQYHQKRTDNLYRYLLFGAQPDFMMDSLEYSYVVIIIILFLVMLRRFFNAKKHYRRERQNTTMSILFVHMTECKHSISIQSLHAQYQCSLELPITLLKAVFI